MLDGQRNKQKESKTESISDRQKQTGTDQGSVREREKERLIHRYKV